MCYVHVFQSAVGLAMEHHEPAVVGEAMFGDIGAGGFVGAEGLDGVYEDLFFGMRGREYGGWIWLLKN